MVRLSFLFPCCCLDIVKTDKTPLTYSFHISIWRGLVHSLGGLSLPNDDGTGRMWRRDWLYVSAGLAVATVVAVYET